MGEGESGEQLSINSMEMIVVTPGCSAKSNTFTKIEFGASVNLSVSRSSLSSLHSLLFSLCLCLSLCVSVCLFACLSKNLRQLADGRIAIACFVC